MKQRNDLKQSDFNIVSEKQYSLLSTSMEKWIWPKHTNNYQRYITPLMKTVPDKLDGYFSFFLETKLYFWWSTLSKRAKSTV